MKKVIAVYVMETNSIGVIIDQGEDNQGKYYRTDCDGIRDPNDLLFLHTKNDVKECLRQLKANIAPSTKTSIGI